MDKKLLRRSISQQKRNMTETEIIEKSAKLTELFLASDAYRKAESIYGYLSFNQEVRTSPLLLQALKDGKKVAVPKVYGEEMRFLYIQNLDDLAPGYYDIPEPIADEPVADDPTALVLMPGLAFDAEGHRVGYGGGFYDKFLEKEPNHPTFALCFDFQMFPHLDTQDHDIPVDCVLWA